MAARNAKSAMPDTKSYEAVIEELHELLASVDPDPSWDSWTTTTEGWLKKLREIHTRRDQPEEIELHARRVLESFGGMGSLNDLFLSPQAGHKIGPDKKAIAAANAKLNQLRDDLHQLAKKLLR